MKRPPLATHHSPLTPSRRGGAVIVVVLTLLSSLAFLGFFYYSWSKTAVSTAQNFAEQPDHKIDPDVPLDLLYQQIIVSTPDAYPNSVLQSGQVTVAPGDIRRLSLHSLLAHTIGIVDADGRAVDLGPHTGRGIGVFATADNNGDGFPDASTGAQIVFDYNNDGMPDADGTDFRINFSPLASGGTYFDFDANPGFLFTPDAGYTYPDINSLFLAHDAQVPVLDAMGNLTSIEHVVTPSFARPQLFPDRRTAGFADLYSNTTDDSPQQVFRPHREHLVAGAPFAMGDLRNYRYLRTATTGATGPAQTQTGSGERNRIIQQFDFFSGQPGIYAGVGQPIQFDVDANGDGTLDAIWLDLGHPPIDLPDGRQAVPLYYVKILDGDGLINLNVHGNLGLVTSINHPVGNGNPASTSNMGLSRSEVSPVWALLANPGNPVYLDPADIPYALQEHAAFFTGLNPAVFYGGTSDTIERLVTANMELTWLRIGRTQSTLGPNIPGLWGEASLLGGATAPAPGRTITMPAVPANVAAGDDNRDSNAHVAIFPANSRPYGGFPYQDPLLALLTVPPFVHPLDYRGSGRYLNTSTVISPQGFKRLLQTGLLANNPSTFPQYYSADVTSVPPVPGWQEQVNTAAPVVYGVTPWRLGVNSAARPLQPDPFTTDQLLDDPDEVVLDGNFPSNVDAPFLPTEIAAFQLSDQHWKQTGDGTRARNLAPVNLVNNREAHHIRQQFTTESWDRREFSISPQVGLTGPAAWSRTWEFNDINAATGANRFPPLFTAIVTAPQSSRLENVNAGVPWAGNPNIAPEDPFRPEIRRLLTVELNNTGNIASGRQFPRHRLNLNRILADDSSPDRGAHVNPITGGPFRAFDSAGNPQYRQLVPHADFTGAPAGGAAIPPMIHNHYDPAPYPFAMIATDPIAQEWWARHDRQRLARDIYVLLYTLCHNDSVNPTAAGATDAALIREMAQFAVNYVDALDRDDVITRFYYDDNLSDGWNSPTSVVDGVEAQSLTFSEVLWARGDRSGSGANAAETIWDESMDAHDFLYLELRNATPFDVRIDALDQWRIVRQDSPTAGMPVAVNQAEVEFRVPTIAPTTPFIGPGENFLIACQDNAMTVTDGSGTVQTRSSDMYIQFDPAMTGSAAFQMVAPYNKDDADASLPMAASEHPERTADLDLSYTGPNEHSTGTDYEFTTRYDPTMLAPGTLVAVNDTATTVDFVLQRRRHLNAFGAIADADNEWIEVDRVTATAQVLNPDGGGFAAKILELRSTERSQPFDPEEREYSLAPTSLRSHTLGDPAPGLRHKANSELAQGTAPANPTAFTLWQPHFNRDFSSAMELLSLPLYGVRADTDTANWDVVHFGGPCANLAVSGGLQMFPQMTGRNATGAATAALTRIRNPVGLDDMDPMTPNPLQNRWYRLFEFVEVPSRSESTLYDRLLLHRRTPGCINLNTVRHEAVLAGLIDDPQIRRFGDGAPGNEFDPGAGRFLTDDRYDATRNWFRMFLYARDGVDTFTNAPLPGVPGARPFRGPGYVDPQTADASIQHTILRGHAGTPITMPVPTNDPAGLASFGLFEARSLTDVSGGTPEPVDFHTRNRLLAKIANNSTTRSHVFMIWAGYELFEAHQPAPEQFPNVVQVGARITDLPGRREFTVVDMTRLEEAYNPVTGAFDFRKFIIYRKRIK